MLHYNFTFLILKPSPGKILKMYFEGYILESLSLPFSLGPFLLGSVTLYII